MSSHRTDVDVIGHNLSNAHTEGYSKQDAVLRPTSPFSVGGSNRMEMGTGVEVTDITRRTNRYLDREIYRRSGEAEYWESRKQKLSEIEDILAEPGDSGISAVMDRFWNSWQELSSEPDSMSARTSVIERAEEMGDAFSAADRQMENMLDNLDQTAESRVERVNGILDELEDVTDRIRTLEGSGTTANDLLDQRDRLVEELSGLIDLHVSDSEDGGVRLMADGTPILDSYTGRRMEMEVAPPENEDGEIKDFPDEEIGFQWKHEEGHAVQWEDPPSTGELGSLTQMRNEDVPRMLEDLRSLADGIREAVNEQHGEGFDLDGDEGDDFFFNGEDAQSGVLTVDEVVRDDPRLLAAASDADGVPGDGSNARALANLKEEDINIELQYRDETDNEAPGEFLRSVVADLGIRAEQAEQQHGNNHSMLTQLKNSRDADTGVSIDEEMTHLIQSQNAFNASARLVRVWDEMLDTVVNGLVR